MKIDLKVVFLFVAVLCQLCCVEGCGGGGSGGGEGQSSRGRSRSRSASTRTSSSTRRGGWFGRRSSNRSPARTGGWFLGRRSSSSRKPSSGKNFPHDIKTKSGLTKLYNKEVTKVQKVQRPLRGPLGLLGIKHFGSRVTLKNGKQLLVHKGKGFGKSSQTVVVDAKHMSNKWSKAGQKKRVKGKTVGDFVNIGGKDYNFLCNNCKHAAERMQNLGKRSQGRKK